MIGLMITLIMMTFNYKPRNKTRGSAAAESAALPHHKLQQSEAETGL